MLEAFFAGLLALFAFLFTVLVTIGVPALLLTYATTLPFLKALALVVAARFTLK